MNDRAFGQLQAILATLAPGQGARIPASFADRMEDFDLPPGVLLYAWQDG